ncbi:chordin-like isoform X3 [Sander vitreus]
MRTSILFGRGKLVRETFSSTLTSEEENSGMGGLAMLTLSDTENNLNFVLILVGLIKQKDKEPILVPSQVSLCTDNTS